PAAPGQVQVTAAEVAVGGGLLVDRPAQVQVGDDLAGAQVEQLPDDLAQALVADLAGALAVHQHAHRVAHADGVGQLDVAPPGQARRHDVLGDVPGHVGGGAVHLGGVLAGEAPAAVAGGAAVGVHDDLPAGEAAVPHGAANDEAASGIDVELGGAVDVLRRDDGLHHRLDDGLPQLLGGDLRAVLGGDHDGGTAQDVALPVVLHGDLALAVGPQPAEFPVLAHGGQPPA